MSENVNISFIPKKSLAHTKSVQYRSILGVSVLIPLAITFGVIGYSVWEYAQVQSLTKDRNDKITYLEDYENKLEQDTVTIRQIDELKSLIKQIDMASVLLNKHVALTDLFNYIGTITPSKSISPDGIESLKPVTYQSFSYLKSPEGVRITMTGQADTYAILGALSQLYKKKTQEKPATMLEFTLSGFSENKEGKIGFTLNALINPDRISYRLLYGGDQPEETPMVLNVTESATMATSSSVSSKK